MECVVAQVDLGFAGRANNLVENDVSRLILFHHVTDKN